MNGMWVSTRIWNMSRASPRLDAQPLELPAAQPEVVDHPGEQHRREHIRDQTDDQCDREALDRTGAELEQEQRAENGGEVRVENGAERARVAEVHRLANALAVAQLLADALEDQHVGVDRHSDREHETRETRQREGGAEAGEAGEDVE